MSDNESDHIIERPAQAQTAPEPNCDWVTIAGPAGPRRLHIRLKGVASGPLVMFEADAYGCAADFAWLQNALAADVASLAYDGPGLGPPDAQSMDVVLAPRDSATIAQDAASLIEALGAQGPVIVVAIGQGACHAHLLARQRPDLIAGLVLLDAPPPFSLEHPAARQVVALRQAQGRLGVAVARSGLLSAMGRLAPDPIGLPAMAAQERRRIMADGRRQALAQKEAGLWLIDADLARASGPLNRELPVAVVATGRPSSPLNLLQIEPARRSRFGWTATSAGASVPDLVGSRHGDMSLSAIRHVLKTLG